MDKRILVALSVLAAMAVPVATQAAGPVMAVNDFENNVTGVYWWSGGVGRDLAGMLTNELAATGAFQMVERARLDAILDEQDLGASGRVDPATAAKIGQMVGAQYLVTGTVTAFEESGREGGGIGFRGIRVGGKKKETYLAVDIRVVDATTGVVAFTRTVEARSEAKGFDVGVYRGGFGGNLAKEKETPAGKAIRAMVIEASDYLECAMVTQGSCMAEFDAKERRRRDGAKDAVKLD
ncbi:MAG: CsgG/HfaB family protein [Acidobacteriota bacterium]|nr:CsgG/HfaB family protein [Acidobacteriota bacterium]MDH3522446.1 CsgG/HfaB family protein [Acidobacteriota bacterium]